MHELCIICFISGPVLKGHIIYDSAHSWWLYSAAPLGNQATGTIIQYPTQSHYPDNAQSSPYTIPLMPSASLGSDKYKFYKSLLWRDSTQNQSRHFCVPFSNCHDNRIGRAYVSWAEGWEFEPRPSQTDDVQYWYMSLPSQALGSIRIV